VLVVPEPRLVVREEHRADEVAPAAHDGLVEDRLGCCCTVCVETTSASAISVVDAPCGTWEVTSRFRSVSP
jgi:hypothetical protein